MAAAVSFVCPDCSKAQQGKGTTPFPTAGELAAHRYDEHGVSPLDAIRELRAKTQEAVEKRPRAPSVTEILDGPKTERRRRMACGICSEDGHRRETCPKREGASAAGSTPKKKPCGDCHRKDGTHSARCRYNPARRGPKAGKTEKTKRRKAVKSYNKSDRQSLARGGPASSQYDAVSKDLQARIIALETETQNVRAALAVVEALGKENGHGDRG